MSYGYENRPPMPDRIIKGPPQAQPRNQWPRRLSDLARNEREVIFRQLQYGKMCDNTRLIAATNLDASASGGGGSKSSTSQTWYSRISRFCRTTAITHSSGGFGYSEERVGFDYSLWRLVSNSAQPGAFVLRFEDVISAGLTDNLGSETCSGCVQFGLRQANAAPSTLVPDGPFIGFYASQSATTGGGSFYPNWHYIVCADSGGNSQSADTGISTEDPHRLTCDIDAQTGTCTFLIDGVQVAQVADYSGTITHTTDDGGLSWIVGAGGSGVHNGTMTVGYFMDLQANVWLRVLDEAA